MKPLVEHSRLVSGGHIISVVSTKDPQCESLNSMLNNFPLSFRHILVDESGFQVIGQQGDSMDFLWHSGQGPGKPAMHVAVDVEEL